MILGIVTPTTVVQFLNNVFFVFKVLRSKKVLIMSLSGMTISLFWEIRWVLLSYNGRRNTDNMEEPVPLIEYRSIETVFGLMSRLLELDEPLFSEREKAHRKH